MEITLGPFYTCFFVTCFLAVYLKIITQRPHCLKEPVISVTLVSILIIFIRMSVPLNFPFTRTIYSYKILPNLINFTTFRINKSSLKIVDLFFLIWICIAIVLLIKTFLDYLKLKQYLSKYYINETDNIALFSIVHKYYNKSLKIVIIPNNISPGICGLFKPILILPANLCEYSLIEQEYIIRHEISHIHKKHLWFSLMMEIFCKIHWWNPFVYCLQKKFTLFLELSNDFSLTCIMSSSDIISYTELIINTAKKIYNNKSFKFKMLNFVIPSKRILTTRVTFLLEQLEEKKSTYFSRTILSCVIFIAVIVSMFVVPEARFPDIPSETENAIEITPKNAYIIKSQKNYIIYVDEKYFCTIDHIPNDLKKLPLYKKEGEFSHDK